MPEYKPWPALQDGQDENDILVAASCYGHDHMDTLFQLRITLLTRHHLLHSVGLEEGELHDQTLEWIEKTEDWLRRSKSAVFN